MSFCFLFRAKYRNKNFTGETPHVADATDRGHVYKIEIGLCDIENRTAVGQRTLNSYTIIGAVPLGTPGRPRRTEKSCRRSFPWFKCRPFLSYYRYPRRLLTSATSSTNSHSNCSLPSANVALVLAERYGHRESEGENVIKLQRANKREKWRETGRFMCGFCDFSQIDQSTLVVPINQLAAGDYFSRVCHIVALGVLHVCTETSSGFFGCSDTKMATCM